MFLILFCFVRKVKLDFEDEDMAELACEGVESMLIDWQGGFLGKKIGIFLALSLINNLTAFKDLSDS
jgi:hypothetical protein